MLFTILWGAHWSKAHPQENIRHDRIKKITIANAIARHAAGSRCCWLAAAHRTQAEENEEFTLPISINEVMASLINHSADPIWVAAWRNPETDRDWRELEHLARQLQVGGALLKDVIPVPARWTANGPNVRAGRSIQSSRLRLPAAP